MAPVLSRQPEENMAVSLLPAALRNPFFIDLAVYVI